MKLTQPGLDIDHKTHSNLMAGYMTKPDCQTCGACCWSYQDHETYCDITDEEARAFSPQFRGRNVKQYSVFAMLVQGAPPSALRTKWQVQKAGPFKGKEVCVCCQLEGSLMHKVRCRIYDGRAATCRNSVKPGDKSCRWLRGQLRAATTRK